MNKYIKLALEKKLQDNGINIGDKFRIQYWGEGYVYDGKTLKEDCGVDVTFKDVDNVYGLLTNDFIDMPQYRRIDFETAYRMMSGYRDESINNEDVVNVYAKSDKGEFSKIWFGRMKYCEVDHEFVATDPEMSSIKFSNLYKYEFYVEE